MFKHILVPLDGTKTAEQALAYAVSLAKQYEAKLLLVRAIPEPDVPAAPLDVAAVRGEEGRRARGGGYLREMVSKVRSPGVTVDSQESLGGNATEVILAIAEKEGVDLIVGVSRGRSGLARTIYGSVIDDLVRDPRQPVLVVRATDEGWLSTTSQSESSAHRCWSTGAATAPPCRRRLLWP